MKTFQETLQGVQESINRIKEDALRKQAQSRFDSIPKDESKWVIKSFSGNLETSVPAITNPSEVEKIYRSDVAKNISRQNESSAFYVKDDRGYDIDPGFTEGSRRISNNAQGTNVIASEVLVDGVNAHSLSSIEFDTFYELTDSQPNGDLGTAQRYEINACGSGTSFDIYTFDTDNNRCKDIHGNVKSGTYKTDTQYSFSESTLGKNPYTVISERVNEYGINSDLNRENHFSKTETTLIGGKITEIESKQTLDIEGESRKEKTKTIKTENGKDFEKTIKTESIETIQNVKEKGTLLPGETLDLSKKGEIVTESRNECALSTNV